MRTHLVLPEELVNEVDAIVGKRKRSRYVEDAVRERVRRDKVLAALQNTAGILSAETYPHWATPEDVDNWVSESRQHDTKRVERRPV